MPEALLPENLIPLTKAPAIIACPGSTTCPLGIIDCWKIADKIRDTLKTGDYSDSVISITGCPNGCAKSAIASVGFVGRKKTIDGKSIEHLDVYKNGSAAKKAKLAERSQTITADSAADFIKKLLKDKPAQNQL